MEVFINSFIRFNANHGTNNLSFSLFNTVKYLGAAAVVAGASSMYIAPGTHVSRQKALRI